VDSHVQPRDVASRKFAVSREEFIAISLSLVCGYILLATYVESKYKFCTYGSNHLVLFPYHNKYSRLVISFRVLNFVCQKISDMAEITEFCEISAEILFRLF